MSSSYIEMDSKELAKLCVNTINGIVELRTVRRELLEAHIKKLSPIRRSFFNERQARRSISFMHGDAFDTAVKLLRATDHAPVVYVSVKDFNKLAR